MKLVRVSKVSRTPSSTTLGGGTSHCMSYSPRSSRTSSRNRSSSHLSVRVFSSTPAQARPGWAQLGRENTYVNFGERRGAYMSGLLARLADGAVVGRDENSIVLATACMDPLAPVDRARLGDSAYLTVEYRAKSAAGGQIPSHPLRRELGPRENDIIVSRMIDRSIRPLFPVGMKHPVQVICTTLAEDASGDMAVLALNATSAALARAENIAWNGPLACVRVSRRISKADDGTTKAVWVAFPDMDFSGVKTHSSLDGTDFMVAGTRHGIVMVDFKCENPLPVDAFCDGLKFAEKLVHEQLTGQLRHAGAAVGDDATFEPSRPPQSSNQQTQDILKEGYRTAYEQSMSAEMDQFLEDGLRSSLVEKLLLAGVSAEGDGASEDVPRLEDAEGSASPLDEEEATRQVDSVLLSARRQSILRSKKRPQGRDLSETRLVSQSLGILPVVHGSATFSFGKTSVLCTATLGFSSSQQTLAPYIGPQSCRRLWVHYDFPPYCVHQTGGIGINRRMIDHGKLIERSMLPVLPNVGKMPYTVRVTCETTSSEGSSSMASVCGSTLALMEAGCPLSEPVAGVSIGAIVQRNANHDPSLESIETQYEPLRQGSLPSHARDSLPDAGSPQWAILCDLSTDEAQLSDMDLKLAGTRTSITSAQMDVRPGTGGVPLEVLLDAVRQGAVTNRATIDAMPTTNSRNEQVPHRDWNHLSSSVPSKLELNMSEHSVRRLIGIGGNVIKKLRQKYPSSEIEADVDAGIVAVYSTKYDSSLLEEIKQITWEPQVGEIFDSAVVVDVLDFGTVCELSPERFPGVQGFMHVSQIAEEPVANIEDYVFAGQQVRVKCIAVENGKIKLALWGPSGSGSAGGVRKTLFPGSDAS